MKKILILIVIIAVAAFAYIFITNQKEEIPVLETAEEKVTIDNYYVYGTHFDLEGSFNIEDANFDDIVLTLYNGEFQDIKIDYDQDVTNITFNINKEEINNGFYLDDLERGTYYLFIKATYEPEEEDGEVKEVYYALDNQTDYDEITYYTLHEKNNKIEINSNNDYPTMMFNVTEKKDSKEVYDITIDPGHGGMDSGANIDDVTESDLTMQIAEATKETLEDEGFTVKLTRTDGEYTENEVMEEYNENGRAVIPQEVKSKYTISLHFNSNDYESVRGLEVYTANNINYDLANSLVENITAETGIEVSTNRLFRVNPGVYTHNFTESEVENALAGYEEKDYVPYNVTTNSNYLYMIRETGGILTGAYVDDSNEEEVGTNPYYNSNIGVETYLLELGYLTNPTELDLITSNIDNYAKAIAKSISENIKK